MGMILVEIEEDTYKEINDLMKKADANQATLLAFTDLFMIIEMAVRADKKLTVDEFDMLRIDNIPITQLVSEVQGRVNGE